MKCKNCGKSFVARTFSISSAEHKDWCLKCNADHGHAGRAEFLEEQSRIESTTVYEEEASSPSISSSDFGFSSGGSDFGGFSGGDSGGFSGGGGDSGGGGASGGW